MRARSSKVMQERAWVLQRRAFSVAATAGVTALACSHLDSQRRPLQGCTVPTMPAALSSLRTRGAAIVEGIVDEGLVSAVKATAAYQSIPTRVLRARERAPPPKEWRQSAFGRFHRREEALDESDLNVLQQVEHRFWPLVVAFFEDGEEGGMDGGGMDGVYRSEMQVRSSLQEAQALT